MFSKTGIEAQSAAGFESTLKEMHFFQGYRSEILYKGKNIIIGFSGYEGYPITRYEFDDLIIFFEGKIYNRSENEKSQILKSIAKTALQGDAARIPAALREKLVDLDGEFWFAAIDTTNQKFLIANDSLGKLPLYYHESSNGLTISREISFVRRLDDVHDFDRYGTAQFLMLHYPLGGRTIFSGIKKMPHASFMQAEDTRTFSEPIRYHQWDIKTVHDKSSIEESAERLLFQAKDAVNGRNSLNISEKSIIALSGGLDSRAVLGILKAAGVGMLAASSINYSRSNLFDVNIAEKVAAVQDVEFIRIQLENPKFGDLEKIAEIKPGLNNISMANALGLYTNLLDRFPYGADFYTGDGGASMKTPYRSQGGIKSKDQLLQQIFNTPAVFDDDEMKRLLGLGISDLVDDFEGEVSSYPPESWREKYLYYTVFDYLTNFGYEGEDRSRYFFWTQTPFEAIPFYINALRIPDRFKSGLKLMNRFLKLCDPALLNVVYADYGAKPESSRIRTKLLVRRFMKRHPALLRRMRRVVFPRTYRPKPIEDHLLDYALGSLRHAGFLSNIIDSDYLDKLLRRPISRSRFESLLSLILACRKMHG